jgi:hypothetical protein
MSRYDERGSSGRPWTIDSVTWLNGGMFNGAYRPRPIQHLLSKRPVGGGRVLLSDAVPRRSVAEVFGPRTSPRPS